ncbi:MAG TPA: hypothetical protein VHM26_00315 [Chitinophagaceae bacterium]|nr:hypothetical protein [Chitinophagaceae bacterium]
MKRNQLFLMISASVVVLSSCVSSKKYKASQLQYTELQGKYTLLQTDLNN